jgi:hypothetical protein
MFYDILSRWIPYFTISRNTDFAMANDAELILCDQGGTFCCNPGTASTSLFDCSKGKILTPIADYLELPTEIEMSLHGHTFPVSAGTCARGMCVTADVAGYVHLWSPHCDRISLGHP